MRFPGDGDDLADWQKPHSYAATESIKHETSAEEAEVACEGMKEMSKA